MKRVVQLLGISERCESKAGFVVQVHKQCKALSIQATQVAYDVFPLHQDSFDTLVAPNLQDRARHK